MIPASIRNNNPGAMYPGKSAQKFGSTSFETLRSKDGVHKIATFPTPVHGAAAMFDLLSSKAYVGKTIEQAITRWCGAYYVSTYMKVLEKQGGISRTDVLSIELLRDHEKAVPLARAMAWQEAGRDFPLSEQEWVQAHAMCFATDAKAPEWSPTNDVPSPRPETRQAEQTKKAAMVATLVGGGTAATQVVPLIPQVPDAMTQALANAQAWKGFAAQLATMPAGFQALGIGGAVALIVGVAVKRYRGL